MTWGVGIPIGFLTLALALAVGIRSVTLLVIVVGAGTAGLTSLIVKHVSYNVPLRCVPTIVWHELGAPRAPQPRTIERSMKKVKIG